jgi:hypothetical protein
MFDKIGIWLDDLEDLVKASDWKKITLVTIIPVIVAFILGGFFFSKKVTLTQSYTTSEVGKLFSTQDLPTQIGNIENNELKVVQGQLADIQVEQEKDKNGNDTDFALNFTKLNAETDLNNFFKTLIGIRFDTKVDTAYKSLKPYLASSVNTETPISEGKTNKEASKETSKETSEEGEIDYSVQKNIYNLLASKSWGKETQSTTALAGKVMVSVMSGSTSANKYFQVLVPVTNDKRDFALLNYIVKTNKDGKVLACTYTGALKGYSDMETYYKKLADLLNGNTVRDDKGGYNTNENKEDFAHHQVGE